MGQRPIKHRLLMNSKMYLPIACLIFCIVYVIVSGAPPLNQALIIMAAVFFALMLFKASGGGGKGK